MTDTKERCLVPFARPYHGGCEGVNLIADRIAWMLNGEGRESNGENCRELEERVRRISGADYAITTNNCTNAMMIMLATCARDKVRLGQLPSFTWPSTLIAMNAQKYPEGIVLHDIDYETWTVKSYPYHSHPAIALAVDTFGNDTNPISEVPLFFDRAHSLGVKFREIGLASALSFSRSKLVTGGEGGMILTNRKAFVQAMVNARDMTCRMDEKQAIEVLVSMGYLPEMLEWKRETYDRYKQAFPMFAFQQGQNWNHQVIGMLLESHEQQDKLIKECTGIEFKAYYEPIHTKFKYKTSLPVTEDISRRIIALPSWYKCDRDYIIRRIKETLEL